MLTFMSAYSAPIALRFEIWIPDRENGYLFYHAGTCEKEEDIRSLHKNIHVRRGDSLLGKVWLTGIPAISRDLINDKLINEASASELSTRLVMSIIE